MMLSVSLLPVQSASVHVVLWLVGIRMPPHIKGRWCCLAPEKFKRLRKQEQCGKKECSEWWKILTQRQSYTEKKNKLEHNEKKNEWKLQPHNQLPHPSSSLLQFMWPSQATPKMNLPTDQVHRYNKMINKTLMWLLTSQCNYGHTQQNVLVCPPAC